MVLFFSPDFFSGGYCLALDMTARDFQNEAKTKGLPWTMAKVEQCISINQSYLQHFSCVDLTPQLRFVMIGQDQGLTMAKVEHASRSINQTSCISVVWI
jgi:hypothetical protein